MVRMRSLRLSSLAALAAVALTLSACSSSSSQSGATTTSLSSSTGSSSASAASTSECPKLTITDGWAGDNAAKLQKLINDKGNCGSRAKESGKKALAVFDWDNTVVRNDIGDATTYWIIANSKILQPEGKDWGAISSWLTADAKSALSDVCSTLAEPGEPLPTGEASGEACGREILSIYGDSKTTGGKDAFENFNARRIEPAYAFAAQLMAGYDQKQVKEFAKSAMDQNLAAAQDTKQTVAGKEVTGWVAINPQIKDLIATMKKAGFDVRIVSASSRPVAQVWATQVGLDSDAVIGVTTVEKNNKLTGKLVSCGGDEEAMTYIEGKRCFINKEILGINSSAAFEQAPEEQRQVFGAGDSDTDVVLVNDATALKLALNRNKSELMCRAYANEDGKWIVNPLFIKPGKQKTDKYPCSTKGMVETDGSDGPLLDAKGAPVEDQVDSVY